MYVCIYRYRYIYRANAHVMYEYISIGAKSGYVNGYACVLCVRVRSRAGADDALIRGMSASAARSLRKAIHRWNTHIHSVRIPNACMYLYACASGYTDAGPPYTRPRAASVRARVCACAIGRPRIRAEPCEHVPSLSTAVGSARRRSARRKRSTRTSARGIPPRSPRCPLYAPPLRPGRRATAGGTRSAGSSMRRGPLCAAATADARARMRAQTCGPAHARAPRV
jgi:hypothetical protein